MSIHYCVGMHIIWDIKLYILYERYETINNIQSSSIQYLLFKNCNILFFSVKNKVL